MNVPDSSQEEYPSFVRRFRIGTSGWHYEHWQGPFYPQDLPSDKWLAYYTKHLPTVEINNSFYQLPAVETLRQWRTDTPEDFVFAVKASRYITHMKKLKDPDEPVSNFMTRVCELGDKLGPILFQLPPHWNLNLDRLRSLLELLPEGHRFAFEFRDTSWFDKRVYEMLAAHDAAFCIYQLSGHLSPKQVTTDWVYVRLHGPGDAYQGKYDVQTLSGWMGAFSTWARQGKEVYCYFDNDEAGYAVQNALTLQAMANDGDES
jgi:uncharacterized protein YecE (DUF72 family)